MNSLNKQKIKFMKIRKNILPFIGLIIAFNSALLFTTSANAAKKAILKESSKAPIGEQIKQLFVKDYDTELFNSLAQIQADLKNHNMKAVYEQYDEISDALNHYKSEMEKHKEQNVQLSTTYKGDKVLELEYGNWFSSRKIILPLNPGAKPFNVDSLKDRIVLSSYFKKNEINDASVEYVTYNTDSDKFRLDLRQLLSGIEEENADYISKAVKNVYEDAFTSHSSDISLVAKIRDSLVVAKYLIDSNQYKAAKNIVGVTDGLVLKLIEATSDSPVEQEKIRKLHKELNSISKVSDANYISQWEKIPEGIEHIWKK